MNFYLLFQLQPQPSGDLWRKDSHSPLKIFSSCSSFFRFYCSDIESFEFYDINERCQNVDVTRK
jgi:hypothetical protein